ncbi:hypothetical protein [Novosphingobium sp.]|uniref:hypothetical protein n=1 Tax=Novosphingobium sp. TaxID=1874826 RepID=UPI0025D99C3E|nr:hypothetical protein [Novosphingobium sp.]
MTRALANAAGAKGPGERRRSGRVTSGLGTGWRTVLTDLSLILFMVTASVLPEQPTANASEAAKPASSAPLPPGERSQPVAVWRPGPGAPSLVQWLASADGRALLSLRVTYRKDHASAVARAASLATAAGDRSLRVLVEPGPGDTVEATLAYDAPTEPSAMARSLQDRH